jgi:hypothetical protein
MENANRERDLDVPLNIPNFTEEDKEDDENKKGFYGKPSGGRDFSNLHMQPQPEKTSTEENLVLDEFEKQSNNDPYEVRAERFRNNYIAKKAAESLSQNNSTENSLAVVENPDSIQEEALGE